MDPSRPDVSPAPTGETEETFCYGHPDRPTKLRCTRCDRPICGQCAIPASVGQHCPECVAAARRSAPKVRSTAVAKAPVVVGILIVNAVFFVAQLASPEVTNRLVMDSLLVGRGGEWWRLLTAMVLHAPNNFIHIGFNSLVLWIYGPHLEAALGRGRFLMTYLVAGFAGSAASYGLGACTRSLGASGAIFGVVGALLVFLYRRRTSLVAAQFLRGMMFFVGINLVFGFVYPGIDNLAHLGGLFGGAALGAGLDRGISTPPPVAVQAITVLAVAGVSLALVLYRTATFTCGGIIGF